MRLNFSDWLEWTGSAATGCSLGLRLRVGMDWEWLLVAVRVGLS